MLWRLLRYFMREVSISILINDGDRLDGVLSNAYDYALYGLHLGVRCRNVYVHHGYVYVLESAFD